MSTHSFIQSSSDTHKKKYAKTKQRIFLPHELGMSQLLWVFAHAAQLRALFTIHCCSKKGPCSMKCISLSINRNQSIYKVLSYQFHKLTECTTNLRPCMPLSRSGVYASMLELFAGSSCFFGHCTLELLINKLYAFFDKRTHAPGTHAFAYSITIQYL